MMKKLAQLGEGGGFTPTLFHYNNHHVQSCGVRSSWEGRHTHPISTLPLYVLFASYHHTECKYTQYGVPEILETVYWERRKALDRRQCRRKHYKEFFLGTLTNAVVSLVIYAL